MVFRYTVVSGDLIPFQTIYFKKNSSQFPIVESHRLPAGTTTQDSMSWRLGSPSPAPAVSATSRAAENEKVKLGD